MTCHSCQASCKRFGKHRNGPQRFRCNQSVSYTHLDVYKRQFGHQIEAWMIENAIHELRPIVLFFWRIVRWSVALATSATVLTALYHFGTRRKEHWLWVVPGAVTGTLLWFPATLAFGFYVTRIADYSMFCLLYTSRCV